MSATVERTGCTLLWEGEMTEMGVGWVGCPVVLVVTSAGCGSGSGGWWELR